MHWSRALRNRLVYHLNYIGPQRILKLATDSGNRARRVASQGCARTGYATCACEKARYSSSDRAGSSTQSV